MAHAWQLHGKRMANAWRMHGNMHGECMVKCMGRHGYPESSTDQSCEGRILVIMFPLAGNYCVPSDECDSLGPRKYFENDRIHVRAVAVADYSFLSSHYASRRTLDAWLKSECIPGVYGADTRAVTKLARTHGAILGRISIDSLLEELRIEVHNTVNLAAKESRSQPQTFEPEPLEAGLGSTVHITAVVCVAYRLC